MIEVVFTNGYPDAEATRLRAYLDNDSLVLTLHSRGLREEEVQEWCDLQEFFREIRA